MIVTEYMSHGALDGFLRVSGLGPRGVLTAVLFFILCFSLRWDLHLASFPRKVPLARLAW